ncbi:MAG: FAD-dependent oxidoreductase [Acidimicrobiales bacterium]
MAEETRTTGRLASTEPVEATEIAAWDLEADVVVVGLGASGACAALGAVETGADVLVLEASGGAGGTSAMSGGLTYLGGGTPIQEACGYEDTPDDMFRFLMAACGPGADEAKVRLDCDGSVDHYHWLVDHGVPFKAGFYPEPGIEPPTDDALVYSGGEDAHPFDRIARPAPRGHKPQKRHAAGGFLMERLAEAVAATTVRVVADTRVQRLVLDGTRVVGLVARQGGRDVAVRAHGGVVLCAGGFVHSDDMVARHAPLVATCSLRLGNDFDDGTGIRLAQSIGAAVMRMDAAECAVPMTPPRSLVAGILVNGQGQRFINEDTYYGRVGQEVLFRQEGGAYLIVDEALYEVTRAGLQASWVCETVDELEAEIGLPPGSLVSTFDLYQRHAADGVDPVFHKAGEFVRPLVPPLGAYDLRVANPAAFYATFTLGGLSTTVAGEVLTVDGTPVAGLFAAGRTTSGIAAGGYVSGISLGDGTFFGRRAGRAAATATRPPIRSL